MLKEDRILTFFVLLLIEEDTEADVQLCTASGRHL